MAAAVKKVQDAITANGGTVLATVDNAADTGVTGVTVPANTVVIGGASATGLPMLRANQQAAAALPERYLLRQDGQGKVSLVYNGPDYVAAVSGVTDLAASNPFAQATWPSPNKPPGAGRPPVRAVDRRDPQGLPEGRGGRRDGAGHGDSAAGRRHGGR